VNRSYQQVLEVCSVLFNDEEHTPEVAREPADPIEALREAFKSLSTLDRRKQVTGRFPLDPAERALVATSPLMPNVLQKKLANPRARFNVGDFAQIGYNLTQAASVANPDERAPWLAIAQKLHDAMSSWITFPIPDRPRSAGAANVLFQFKITLLDSEPPIWRRIQILDCTLLQLHYFIQSTMSWDDSHLYKFDIENRSYGTSDRRGPGFMRSNYIDSSKTLLSRVVPRKRGPFRFSYLYDFGDNWEHEIVSEPAPPIDPAAEYPLCVAGQGACPPEDCGGIWGYTELIEILRDEKHPEYESTREWLGDSFDPEAFDLEAANRAMQRVVQNMRDT